MCRESLVFGPVASERADLRKTGGSSSCEQQHVAKAEAMAQERGLLRKNVYTLLRQQQPIGDVHKQGDVHLSFTQLKVSIQTFFPKHGVSSKSEELTLTYERHTLLTRGYCLKAKSPGST